MLERESEEALVRVERIEHRLSEATVRGALTEGVVDERSHSAARAFGGYLRK